MKFIYASACRDLEALLMLLTSTHILHRNSLIDGLSQRPLSARLRTQVTSSIYAEFVMFAEDTFAAVSRLFQIWPYKLSKHLFADDLCMVINSFRILERCSV